MAQSRVAPGVPAGGQFVAGARGRSDVGLDGQSTMETPARNVGVQSPSPGPAYAGHLTAGVRSFLTDEIANEANGADSPATLRSALDSLSQGGPDIFGLSDADVTHLHALHRLAGDGAGTSALLDNVAGDHAMSDDPGPDMNALSAALDARDEAEAALMRVVSAEIAAYTVRRYPDATAITFAWNDEAQRPCFGYSVLDSAEEDIYDPDDEDFEDSVNELARYLRQKVDPEIIENYGDRRSGTIAIPLADLTGTSQG